MRSPRLTITVEATQQVLPLWGYHPMGGAVIGHGQSPSLQRRQKASDGNPREQRGKGSGSSKENKRTKGNLNHH